MTPQEAMAITFKDLGIKDDSTFRQIRELIKTHLETCNGCGLPLTEIITKMEQLEGEIK